MFFSKTLRACEVACLFSLLVAPVHAQVNRNGAVAGVITGPDGSSVPAATVSLTSSDGQVRTGSATPPEPSFSLNRFRIEASLDENLRLRAVTRATLKVGAQPLRAFAFEVSRAEQVTAARIDGAPDLRFGVLDFDNTCIVNDVGEATLAFMCRNQLLRYGELLPSGAQPCDRGYHERVFRHYH